MEKKLTIVASIIIALGVLGAVIGIGYYYGIVQKIEQYTVFKEYYDMKVAQFEEENKTIDSVEVAFLGDSLTDGCDISLYYPQYVAVNRGIGGDTTFGLEKRLKVSAYDVNPKVVVMLIGANNFGTMMNNYERIVKKLKSNLPDTKIILLSLSCMGKEWGRNNSKAVENNTKIKSIASRQGCYFVDIFEPLKNPATNQIYDEYTIDGGHWTDLGYKVVVSQVTPVLVEILGH